MATIYTHSPVDLASFDREDLPDVRSVFLTGDVLAEIFGEEGEPGLELRTAEMELSVPPGWEDEQGLPPVECPKPLEIRRSDGSLVLKGSSGEFDATRRRVLIHPPVEVVALVGAFGERFDSLVEKGVAQDEPLVLHCDGDLEYTWTAAEPTGEELASADETEIEEGGGLEGAESLRRDIGDGVLTLRDAVRARQGEAWLDTEFLRVRIVREDVVETAEIAEEDAAGTATETRPEYRVEELEAYDHQGAEPVRFGMLEGQGHTGKLHVMQARERVEFQGPVHFEGFTLGEAERRTTLDLLEASEKLVLQRHRAPVVEGEEPPPERLALRLLGDARVDVRDQVLAEAGEISLDLRAVPSPELPEEDAAKDEGTGWEPERLELREDSSLVMQRPDLIAGEAHADEIDYLPGEDRRRTVILRGKARCVVDGEALDGPLRHADVRAPHVEWSWTEALADENADAASEDVDEPALTPEELEARAEARRRQKIRELDFDLFVPELREATFTLEGVALDQLGALRPGGEEEAGTEPPAPTAEGAELAEGSEDGERATPPELITILKVFPETHTRLEARSQEVHFLGRAEYRSVRDELLLHSVRADRFDALFIDEQNQEVEAVGEVIALSPADGTSLNADRVDFGDVLQAQGAPARMEMQMEGAEEPVILRGEHLRFDPESGELRAWMEGPGLVHLSGPADRIAQALPEEKDTPESSTPGTAEAVAEGAATDGDVESGAAGIENAVARGDVEPEEPSTPNAQTPEEPTEPEPATHVDLWARSLLALRAEEPEDSAEETGTPDEIPEEEEDEALPFSNLVADGEVRLLQDDGTELLGDRVDVEVATEFLRLVGTPAVLLRPSTLPDSPKERAEAEWMELRRIEEVPQLTVAPGAVMEFFLPASSLDDEQPDGESPDAPRRVQVRAADRIVLDGATLTTEGGIETEVFLRSDHIRASSERLEVLFDRSPLLGGTPQKAFARRDVLLVHPWFECKGAALSFDFVDEWLELRSGIERCEVVGSSKILPVQLEGMDATFRQLKCRLRSQQGTLDQGALDDLFIEDLRLTPRRGLARRDDP